jgi:hypothetical protein
MGSEESDEEPIVLIPSVRKSRSSKKAKRNPELLRASS